MDVDVMDGSESSRRVKVEEVLRDLGEGMHPRQVAAKHRIQMGDLLTKCRTYKWTREELYGDLALSGQRARMGPHRWRLYCRLWEIAMGAPLLGWARPKETAAKPAKEAAGEGGAQTSGKETSSAAVQDGAAGAGKAKSVRPETALRAILAMLELSQREPLPGTGVEEAEDDPARARIMEGLRLLAEKESRENAA